MLRWSTVAVALPALLGTRVQSYLCGWGTCYRTVQLSGTRNMRADILPWAVWVALGDTELSFVTDWRRGTGPRWWMLLIHDTLGCTGACPQSSLTQ